MTTNGPNPSFDPNRPYNPNPNEPNQPGSETKSGAYSKDKDTEHYEKTSYKEKAKVYGEKVQDKLKDTYKNIKDSKQVDDVYRYARSNKENTIAYVVLALGLII